MFAKLADKPTERLRLAAARGYDAGCGLAGAFAQDCFRDA
jgi:hypothetical protein